MAIPHMPAYASGGVVYTRPLRAGSRRETAVTGGPESCNLGSGPVNSGVNFTTVPSRTALGSSEGAIFASRGAIGVGVDQFSLKAFEAGVRVVK